MIGMIGGGRVYIDKKLYIVLRHGLVSRSSLVRIRLVSKFPVSVFAFRSDLSL